MGSDKANVQGEVERQVVEATAMQISPKVAEAHQERINDEMQAAHLQNIGMMAIQNAIDGDKTEYENQLDEIRGAMEKAQKELSDAGKRRDKTIEQFKARLVRTELRKKAAASLRTLNKLPHLKAEFQDVSDDDIDATFNAPDPDGDSPQDRAGHISWQFSVKQKGDYRRDGVSFAGTRNLSKKCTDALKKVAEAEADVQQLSDLNREVRLQIQRLERERRDLERKLRKEIVSKSMVGQQVEDMLKNSRKKVKSLPMPAKFRKKG